MRKFLVSFCGTRFTGEEVFGNLFIDTDEPLTQIWCTIIEKKIVETYHPELALASVAIINIIMLER